MSVTGIGAWKGLNAADDPAMLPVGECEELLNLETSSGALRRRPGFRLLAAEEVADAAWPPYLPPVETPDTTPTMFFDVALPVVVIEGDAFALRLEAQDRSGNPVATYAGDALLSLVVEADDGGGWTAFAGLALAAGGSPDPTTGWEDGVWEASVVVADIDGNLRLRVALALDSVTRAEDTATFAELAEIVVDLPAAVTPDVAFRLSLEARDALGATLPEYAGSALSLAALGGDGETALVLADEHGAALDPTSGWTNGRWSVLAVLADPDGQESLSVSAEAGAVSLGDDEAEILQLWLVNAPTALQSYQEADISIRARTAAGADWEEYDGADAGLSIQLRSFAGVWADYEGLTDADGDALDISAGWSGGAWSQTVRFAEADGDMIRIVLTSYGIAQWTWQIRPWPLHSAQLLAPAACASLSPIALSLLPLDERGYLLPHYLGEDLALAATDQDDAEVALTDGDGAALDLTAGWDEGYWTGSVMFEDEGLAELNLSLSWNGTVLATATLAVGAAAPGVAVSFNLWAPPAAHAGEDFPLVLVAYDAFGNPATSFAGEGIALAAYGVDSATGEETAFVLTHDDLSSGWENGAWLGDASFAETLGCETLRIVALLDGAEAGEAETAIALSFVLSVPATVQEGNTFLLAILATRADGAPAADFAGEDLALEVYVSSGGAWAESSVGTIHLSDAAAWSNGRYSQGFAAPADGTYRFVLLHEDEEEQVAEMIVTEDLIDDDDLPGEDEEIAVRLDVALPAHVYAGVSFGIGVAAAVEGRIGVPAGFDAGSAGGSLSVSPAVTPAPDLAAGWDGLYWAHSCKLATPVAEGTLVAVANSAPTVIPEGKTPSDYQDTATAEIHPVEFSVSLPATFRTGVSGTLRIVAQGDGATLPSYDGAGFSLRVDTYENGAWTEAAAALTTSDGGALPTTFVAGRITCQVKLGSVGNAEKVRVVALFLGEDAGSDEATVLSRWEADLSGVTYLHPFLPAQTLEIDVETWGAEFAASALAVAVEGLRDGAWVEFPNLVDGDGNAVDWTAHWTGASFSCPVAITGAGDFSQCRIRVSRNGSLAGELEFDVAEDLLAYLAAPEEAVAGTAFDLTIVVRDRRANDLVLYAGQDGELVGTGTGGAELSADSLETGWIAGQWDGECSVSAECESFRIGMEYAGIEVGYLLIQVRSAEYGALRGIYERQLAAGVATEDLIDREWEYYSLGELCAEANKFAGSSTNGVRWMPFAGWTDKTAVPSYLTDAGYFGIVGSGATVEVENVAALYAEVIKFTTSFFGTVWTSGGDPSTPVAYSGYYEGQHWSDLGGGEYQDQEAWSVTKSGAAGTWAEEASPADIGVYSKLALSGMYYTPTATLHAYLRDDVGIAYPDTRQARTLQLWAKAVAPTAESAAFDALGCGVGNGVFGKCAEKTLSGGAANSLPIDRWSGATSYPSWPATEPSRLTGEDPGTPSLYSAAKGWLADGNPVVVIEWEFSD